MTEKPYLLFFELFVLLVAPPFVRVKKAGLVDSLLLVIFSEDNMLRSNRCPQVPSIEFIIVESTSPFSCIISSRERDFKVL